MLKLNAVSKLSLAISLASAAAAISPAQTLAQPGQSRAVTNARVFTGRYSMPLAGKAPAPIYADSMVVDRGTIVFVGGAAEAQAFIRPDMPSLNLHGKLVLPGFHDCHVHLCEGGIEQKGCQLYDVQDKAAALTKLKAWANAKNAHQTDNSKDWIFAYGLPLPAVSKSPLSTNDIDRAVSTRPTVIYSEDCHSLWLSSRAMQIVGLSEHTPTPPTGVIERDGKGRPNGAIREAAMDLIEPALPVLPLAERAEALKKIVSYANSLGITSIQDAHAKEEFLETYYELASHDQLNLKVVAALHVGQNFTDKDFDHLVELRSKYSAQNLHPTSAKIFADGVIETRTAAMLEAYKSKEGNDKSYHGTLNYEPAELKRVVRALDARDFQIHIHAIGDRAVRTALDALEAAKAANPTKYPSHRHQIAHLEIVQKVDQKRFLPLGVIANFQAYWAFNDPYMVDLTAPQMGPERMQLIYPLASIASTGATLAAGSDWTVSTLNPLQAMQVAVTRQEIDNAKAKPLLASERVDLPLILAAYTTGGAWANHSEDQTGMLKVGKAGDFIILDKNIFDLEPHQISKASVLETYIDGRRVYSKN